MLSTTGSSRRLGLGVAFGLLVSGCQLLFGDFDFRPVPDKAAAGAPGNVGGSAGTASTCNESGVYRCNGAALELCDGATWHQQLVCDTAAQCDKEHLRCRPCAPGTLQCSAFRLERCHESGESWALVEECITADRCDAVHGTCATCGVDEAFCSGPQLNVCDSARLGWSVTVCESANLCSTTSRSCRPCVAGEYQCNQNTLQRCNTAQEWVNAEQCASAELCKATLTTKSVLESRSEAWGGTCNPPLCSSGAYRCSPENPAQLQTCPPSRDRWEAVGQPCYTKELCDATLGRCKDGCEPGAYRCNGAELQHCVADGTAWELIQTCPTAAQCSATKQSCMPCVAGEHQCNGAQLERCSPTQTWEKATESPCLTAELCAASLKNHPNDERCDPPGCSPVGAQQCGGTGKNVLQYCPKGQVAWVDKQVCATPGLCDKGLSACIPPVCANAGEPRCTGQNHERCDADRKNWVIDATCTSGQICDVAKGCLGQCPVPAQRCNEGQIEICSIDSITQLPRWVPGKTCASKDLCKVSPTTGIASCGIITCEPAGKYSCLGQTLRVCSPGLDSWNTVETCTATQICDAAGQQCDNCIPGNYFCNGKVLQLCSADGQKLVNQRTDCLSCATSADFRTGYCYVCNRGDMQCEANQIRSCATSGTATLGTAWSAAEPCTSGFGCQVVDGRKDFCAACPTAGEAQCVSASSIHTCAADRSSWGATTACGAAGCISTAVGNDYCASCQANEIQCIDATSIHTCAADGTAWGAASSCANGCVSSTTGDDYCAACATNEAQCIDSASIHTCAADRRSWSADSPCNYGCVVNALGNDFCATCAANEVACANSTNLHTCAPNGSGWGANTACPNGCITVAAGDDYCAACVPDEVACADSGHLHTCAADGSGWGVSTACASGCITVAAGDDYCAACAPNEAECVDESTLRVCAADGSGWGASSACASSCVTVAEGNDFCSVCTAGEAVCADADTLRVCNATGSGWGSPTSCVAGCVVVAGENDVCAPEPTAPTGVPDAG